MSDKAGRRHPHAKAFRNLLLFTLILAAISGLIIIVATMNRMPERIMPPESPEMTAKRTSPDNAFFLLARGGDVGPIPEAPKPITVPSPFNAKLTEPYKPEAGTMGALLDIPCPDNDPAIGEYLAACTPFIDNARTAFAKETFLYPDPQLAEGRSWLYRRTRGDEILNQIGFTFNVLIASMAYTARHGDAEQSVERFADALRFVEALGADSGLFNYRRMPNRLDTVLQYAADAAAYIESPEHLRAMRNHVESLTLHTQPLRPYLEQSWRSLDQQAEDRFGPPQPDPQTGAVQSRADVEARRRRSSPLPRIVETWWEDWLFRRHIRLIRKNKEALLSLAECSSRKDFEEAKDQDPSLRQLWGPFGSSQGAAGDIQYALDAREEMAATRLTAIVALSVELYRRDRGAYPETLDELVPGYLDAIPSLPGVAEEPQTFFYRAEGDRKSPGNYWLYPGPERRDWGRLNEEALRGQVFHCPPVEYRSEPSPAKKAP